MVLRAEGLPTNGPTGHPKYVVLGAGGHARVILDAFPNVELLKVVLLDDDPKKIFTSVMGARVLGSMDLLEHLVEAGFIVGVGSVGPTNIRRELWYRALRAGLSPMGWIRATGALVSASASIGDGTFIGPGAVVGAGSEVQENVIINTQAVVEHNCFVGAHSHLASGAILCGGVHVDQGVHVGAGAVVLQGLIIGEGAVVGAGAVVLDSVPEGATVVGNPAKVVKAVEA